MNKNKKIVVALIALVVVIGGIFAYRMMGQDKGDKDIQIVIKADDKTLYDETVDTDAGTLGDLLIEMEKDGDIKLEYETSGYGMFITGMGSDKLYSNDDSASKYWIYSSDNNKQCVDAGYCDAADALKIKDGDAFVFELAEATY
jgi:hypothetical protein